MHTSFHPLPLTAALALLVTTATVGATQGTQAGPASNAERTLAPHFLMLGERADSDSLPLKSTSVRARLSGIIADVEIVQTYANTGQVPLEALYVFPASTRAAVHGLEMRIGDRLVKAQIQEKQQARATYEKAKRESKTTGLLEQQRPNVFQMSLANIAPSAEVVVTLHYTEQVTPTDGIYEFVFPTVVGPRYSKDSNANWAGNPYLGEGQPSGTQFDFDFEIQAGMPLQALTCESHDADIRFQGTDTATLSLRHPAGDDPANRDVVIRYRLAGQQVATGMLLHEQDDEKYFLLTLQPPARVKPDLIPPRDYLFVLDVSGSMSGFPLDTAKGLMTSLLSQLRPADRFNILHFAGGSDVLAPSPLPATAANLHHAATWMAANTAGGGTELLPALQRALGMIREEGRSTSVVVITDGFVDIEKQAFDLVRENLGRANLFTFGIGESVNRHLIEGLARAGQGEPFVVLSAAEASVKARQFAEYISAPVLTGIAITADGFDATDLEPAKIPDLFSQRPIEVIGRWRGEPRGRIHVRGVSGAGPFDAEFDVSEAARRGRSNPALRSLWARERIRTLSDGTQLAAGSKEAREVTDIGLRCPLLTEFTSFVAVDEQVQQLAQSAQTVQQPLPLPRGVTHQAVGGSSVTNPTAGKAGSVPEPRTTSLLLLALATLCLQRFRVRHAA